MILLKDYTMHKANITQTNTHTLSTYTVKELLTRAAFFNNIVKQTKTSCN